MYEKGRAWIELDRSGLLHNLKEIQKIAGGGCALMPAVKANAYGHGAPQVSRILEEAGVTRFCVASVGEGIELREAGISGEILVLGYTHPSCFPELREYRLTQTVVDRSGADELDRYGCSTGCAVPVHVSIDTGMHRLGERSENICRIAGMWELKGIRITGVFSHLCTADGESTGERAYTLEQIRRFSMVTEQLHCMGLSGFQTHLCGSYGILNYSEHRFDCARPGIALYGVCSSMGDKTCVRADLRPVLTLKARVECVKELHSGEGAGYGLTYLARGERRIAIVSAGYADGIPRELSNRGTALVKGKRVPVIGRICMDQLTLDVTDVPEIIPGDEAVFIGRCGGQTLSAEEMAETAGTITNEILSRLGGRLERMVV